MRPILPFVLLLLGACGFHPRGEIVLPAALERASLEVADPFSPVARDLRDALLRAGVVLVPPGTEGAGAIRVPVNQVVRDTLVVSANAKVQEYVVRHRVELRLPLEPDHQVARQLARRAARPVRHRHERGLQRLALGDDLVQLFRRLRAPWREELEREGRGVLLEDVVDVHSSTTGIGA